ncbi:MAG: hypothetical protein ACR2IH_12165 [Pyrinomonadaceae bacterium]
MDKTARSELHRTFLIEALPEPLTRASTHIQIFDNYIAETRLRLRSVRVPESKEWTYILQQRSVRDDNELFRVKFAEIYLDTAEHSRFEIFEGTEIRKNRYFLEFDAVLVAFDVYIGKLWGLNTARVEFDDEKALLDFEPPAFAMFDVTNNSFFLGENLVSKSFDDVRGEVAKLGEPLRAAEFSDE